MQIVSVLGGQESLRTKNRRNRAQTSPEPGTLLDARVNTVFSASPIL